VPELPDVEGFKRYFARHAKGRRVREVVVPTPAIVRNSSPQGLGAAITGRRFEAPIRHGKWMLAPAEGPALAVHFGMTGFLVWSRDDTDRHRHDRAILVFDEGELRYRNMRMLGGLWLVRRGEDLTAAAGELGPDAAAIDGDSFDELLKSCRGGLKALLMNQRQIAGIGNELADEVLWRARIHPARPCGSLDARERGRLYRELGNVISVSTRHGRIPTERRWLKSRRRDREPVCPRCGRSLERGRIAGRTTFWCPGCQPRAGS